MRVCAGCERDEASRDWWVGYESPELVVGSVRTCSSISNPWHVILLG
ncbi:hypothetical protein HMPREF1522_0848 [Actinomyces sp. ICM54]|nr:hypothetical protein HMPREF1522_0848 [Actinomyces sp. ICM54]